ncbi:MAG: protein kinase [Phycisphaera sp.]|nr:protein kinase [Phycisphaera sp.]
MISSSSNTSHNSPSGLSVGDRLDKFEIREQIGAGGFSVVWKGYDPLLDRFVAIKQLTLDPTADEQTLRERFKAESHLQRRASESDPHLVRVYDFIDEARGLFIVMEYVEGDSLEVLLARDGKPMEERQALGIIGGCALALRALHKQNIIHRDLKPANILLPASGGLKICDFGLSALIEEQETLDKGTARYMAPELFAEEPCDARADIYSLGMIAYEMLAGRAKFEESFRIVMRDQRHEALRWMKWHTNMRARPTPLSSLVPSTPATLNDLVARMMDKDAGKRIADADELLTAIRRHYSGTPPTSHHADAKTHGSAHAHKPTQPAPPTAALPGRSKLPIVLAVVLGVQALGLGGYWLWRQGQESRLENDRRAFAVTQFESARQQVKDKQYESAIKVLDELAQQWKSDAQLGQGSLNLAAWARANDAYEHDDIPTALSSLAYLNEHAVNWGDLVPELERMARKRQAYLDEVKQITDLIDKGNFDAAQLRLREQRELTYSDAETQTFAQLQERLDTTVKRDQIDRALASAKRLADSGDIDAAIQTLNDAKRRTTSSEIDDAIAQYTTTRQYQSLLAQAGNAENNNDLAQAITLYDQAQGIRRSDSVTDKLNKLRANQAFLKGQELEAQGRFNRADALYTQALGYDPNHAQAKAGKARLKVADQRSGYLSAAESAYSSGDYDQAVRQYQAALELGDDTAVRDKLKDARVLSAVSKGKELLRQGQVDQAQTFFEQALSLRPDEAQAQRGLDQIKQWREYARFRDSGDALRKEGRYAEAKRDYFRAQKVLDTPAIKQRLEDVDYEDMIESARQAMAQKNWPAARSWLQTAFKLRQTDEARRMLEEVHKNDPSATDPDKTGGPNGSGEGGAG